MVLDKVHLRYQSLLRSNSISKQLFWILIVLVHRRALSKVITYVAEVDINHQVKEWSRLSCKVYAKCGHVLSRSYVHLTHMGLFLGRRTGGPTRRSSKGGWTPLEVHVFLDMHTLQRLHMELWKHTLYEGWAQLRVGFGCYIFDWLALSSLKHGTKTYFMKLDGETPCAWFVTVNVKNVWERFS